MTLFAFCALSTNLNLLLFQEIVRITPHHQRIHDRERVMNAATYCEQLRERVSAEERAMLRDPNSGLAVNEHNRTTVLEMVDTSLDEDAGERAVDSSRAERLEAELSAYLDEYMPETPEAHKWIVLASLYLAFVAHRPMHPIERVGITTHERDGELVYCCPAKVEDSFICQSCPCDPAAPATSSASGARSA